MIAARPGRPAALAWLQALHQPEITHAWSLEDWQRVTRLARRLRLLGRLAEALVAAGQLAEAPPPAQRLLRAEIRLSGAQTTALRWAALGVGQALAGTSYPVVLLKGGAYLAQDLTIGRGRLPSDLDILVPRADLDDAQARLTRAGWSEIPLDEHDRRYYHEWSHEVPPMRHPQHSLELDLHHNILPPVARTSVDAGLLLQQVRPASWPGWQVLDPVDQILHAAAHLFLDPELTDRERDVVDLDGLMRAGAAASPDFWVRLPDRARELGLLAPLGLACHFARAWLATPVPPAVDAACGRRSAWQTAALARVLMPTEPDASRNITTRLCDTALRTRYHLTRMPLPLLVRHAWHKTVRRRPPPATSGA